MEFYFKTIGAKVHLYRTGSFFDEDLGELTQTFTGKLRTNKLFSENFEIEDISGPFSKGQRYRITSTEGLSGVLEKKMWGDRYTFSQSHPNNGSISIPKYQPTTNSGHTPTIEPVHNKNMNFWFGFLLFVVIGGLTAGIITSMDNSEQEQGQDLVSVMELLTMEGHPVYYGDVHEAERFWKGHDQVKVVGIRQAPHNEGALLLMAGDLNHKAITNITINLSSVENKQDIQLEDVLQLVCDYIP